MVWKVAEMAGWIVPPVRAVHVAFGNVLGPDKKMLKSRSGETMKFVELLDEAVERAAAAVASKNPELTNADRAEPSPRWSASVRSSTPTSRPTASRTTSSTGIGCCPSTATRRPISSTRTLASARIFRRAEIDRSSVRAVTPTVAEPQEHALALRILGFDAAVWSTVDTYSPHKLCSYLFDLAQDFTAFYEACPVLKAPDEATRSSRLALADLTARVLEQGLDLLGIRAPEQM